MVNKNIRTRAMIARKSLNAAQRQQAATCIVMSLLQTKAFKNSQHIACYHNYAGEVETQNIIECIQQQNKSCYLPIIGSDKKLLFARVDKETPMQKNQHGILEPFAENTIASSELDLVLTPLVAFNQHCMRLGWGKGHYDRTFSFLKNVMRPTKPYLIGLAYELQRNEKILCEDWDVPLDMIITEKAIYTPT